MAGSCLRYITSLAAAGLDRLIVSIDSANLAEHERNRGLEGLERRLAEGIARARACGLPVQASVTVSRLVRYDELPDTLQRLGFDDVAFSVSAARAARLYFPGLWGGRRWSISTAMSCSPHSTRSAG